jgi:hypothetical protein
MFLGYAIGVWGWHKTKNLRAIPILLLVTFVAQTFMHYWAVTYKNNALIAHIFNPIQFTFLMIFFNQNFKEYWEKKVVLFIAGAMLLYGFINTMFLQSSNTFPSNFLVVSNLLLIILSVNLFLQKLDSVSTKMNIFTEPIFLISLAILTFNIFSFIFFLLSNYMIDKNISSKNLFYTLLFANFLYYSLFIIALIFSLKNSINTRAKN